MEPLSGGRDLKIIKENDSVIRPAGPWTRTVHALLDHLRKSGIDFTPVPRGLTEDGSEILSYLPGDVCNGSLEGTARAATVLSSAAQLLRRYHDATVGFAVENARWQLVEREPFEVICHGDFAPYNVVLADDRVVGIIDFDTAHPGPRAWDVCYALYRFAPITSAENPDAFGTLTEQVERARMFCDAYGLPMAQRVQMAQILVARLRYLVQFMTAQARSGSAHFQKNIADGHDQLYKRDIAYIREHSQVIDEGLLRQQR